jgi:hypothetical protein
MRIGPGSNVSLQRSAPASHAANHDRSVNPVSTRGCSPSAVTTGPSSVRQSRQIQMAHPHVAIGSRQGGHAGSAENDSRTSRRLSLWPGSRLRADVAGGCATSASEVPIARRGWTATRSRSACTSSSSVTKPRVEQPGPRCSRRAHGLAIVWRHVRPTCRRGPEGRQARPRTRCHDASCAFRTRLRSARGAGGRRHCARLRGRRYFDVRHFLHAGERLHSHRHRGNLQQRLRLPGIACERLGAGPVRRSGCRDPACDAHCAPHLLQLL